MIRYYCARSMTPAPHNFLRNRFCSLQPSSVTTSTALAWPGQTVEPGRDTLVWELTAVAWEPQEINVAEAAAAALTVTDWAAADDNVSYFTETRAVMQMSEVMVSVTCDIILSTSVFHFIISTPASIIFISSSRSCLYFSVTTGLLLSTRKYRFLKLVNQWLCLWLKDLEKCSKSVLLMMN